MFGGTRFVLDLNALAETTGRKFPASRNRSKRIHKKLVKRHGGEFWKKPAAFKLPNGAILIHPTLYAEVLRQTRGA